MEKLHHFYILIFFLIIISSIPTVGCADEIFNSSPVLSRHIFQNGYQYYDLNTSWRNKLSSDLLQLLNPESSASCQTSSEIAYEMAKLSQLRYDADNLSEVKVTIILKESSPMDYFNSILNESASDPLFGMITGWIHISSLPELANRTEVQQIRTQLQPAESGNRIVLSPKENQSVELFENKNISGISYSSVQFMPQTNKDEKVTGSPEWKQKLSTDLLQLLDEKYLSPGQSSNDLRDLMAATGELRIIGIDNGEVMVNAGISPGYPTDRYLSYFSSGGSDQVYGKLAGWISVHNLSLLAKEAGIASIMAQIPPLTSRITTEGEYLLHSDDFKNMTNCTGKGVKVGIISDGVSSLSQIVAEGELPDNIHILHNSIGGDEGTAMLQIVHDIAPDAELYFHDRGSSQIEFIQAMDALINQGCRVICDDITYIEPFFEDGYVARNIKDRILSYGILYITSAGNFAQEHYQASFNGYPEGGYLWHDFKGTGGIKDLKFTAPPNSAGHIILQWDDQWSKSSNNYDLFVYNPEFREIGRSVKIQDGDDDPMEYCRFINDQNTVKNFYLRVVQAGGENRTIEIFVLPMGGNPVTLDPCIPEDSMFGQQAVSGVLSIGSVVPEMNNTIPEPFSSRGPVTIKYPKPELREKPELVAPDDVIIATGGGNTASFSGTSASAPHIAALAALIWNADPDLTEREIRSLLINATSSNALTWHPSIGYGIPDARLIIPLLQKKIQEKPDSTIEINYLGDFSPRETDPADSMVLYPGWNMVSIPYPLKSGADNGTIFSEINTSGHTIWRYEGEGNHWISLHPNDTLMQMDVVWVYSNARKVLSLTYDDSTGNMTARHLNAGWNPVGIPGQTTRTAYEIFSPLQNEWSYILVFDPKLQQYRPVIVNGGKGEYSDERLLYPTEGFWVYVNNPGIFMPG